MKRQQWPLRSEVMYFLGSVFRYIKAKKADISYLEFVA